MGKLVDVDKIDWQKGVFVNPNTDEPLPIVHKIATIEMLRDWQKEVEAIPLDKIKDVREEISDWDINKEMVGTSEPFRLGVARGLDIASEILDKLISESEEKNE